MKLLTKVFDSIHRLLVVFAKLLMVLMTVLISAQVFSRYVLDVSIMWSEEVALVMMVWFGFISLAVGVKKKLHISIQIFTDFLPDKLKRVILKFNALVVLIFGIVMMIYGVRLVNYTMTSTLPATGFPSAVLYTIVPITGILVTYDAFMDLFGFKNTDDIEIKTM
ncbi:MAG: hypothetical protein PWP27_850 [Clostridiales bacterium]|jgi:TRAP-type C4-dicarboxylate transport system permease small subunit|nr:hypothetical protein [Clostridiales bacterium]MDK2933040.1 hypothetical protein [Clostridiales bacterium]